ncbi:hypothetical protein EV401DRAFT_1948207 [Pisolithus croceorrhizus]|nr:hypothetical protein EV401DRAFT_1948207 [Pisolithus croceorrhizus]
MSQETETVESLIRGPLIGTLVGLILYGVTSLRAFFYFRTYVDDRMGLRLLVALVVAQRSSFRAAFLRRLTLRCPCLYWLTT